MARDCRLRGKPGHGKLPLLGACLVALICVSLCTSPRTSPGRSGLRRSPPLAFAAPPVEAELAQQRAARALAAVLGAQVADCAAAPSHWVYDPAKMSAAIEAANRGPAFMDPPGNTFYTVASNGLSCYGQQAFSMLSSLAELGRFDVEDFTRRVAEDFGRDSEYEVKGVINESNWPQRIKDVTMPLPGPWRHGSINKFLTNYVVEGKRYPECGSDDAQIDFACRIVPVVALYAGSPELSQIVEVAIRAIQNTESAVKFGLAFAKCLELLILGHAETPSAAVLSVVSSLKAADPEDAEAAGLERVLQDLAAMSLPEAALALKPKDNKFAFAGLA
ncbi:unnamed protein product [Polarella glacialis]|uniref:Uncharacterized protein n=1 Tax=Polarella glacialis TaxID=89957 RepID=A0A813IKE7_POLGL|nr:unnamed protein product [Polarella glacialis]